MPGNVSTARRQRAGTVCKVQESGGERGIRTPDARQRTDFTDRPLEPLGHLPTAVPLGRFPSPVGETSKVYTTDSVKCKCLRQAAFVPWDVILSISLLVSQRCHPVGGFHSSTEARHRHQND